MTRSYTEPMTQREALEKLRRLELAPFGVKSLALFGSTARNEARSGSDLDLLVEFEGRVTFDRYSALWDYLEDELGAKVDLVLATSLRPELRPRVLPEAIRVA